MLLSVLRGRRRDNPKGFYVMTHPNGISKSHLRKQDGRFFSINFRPQITYLQSLIFSCFFFLQKDSNLCFLKCSIISELKRVYSVPDLDNTFLEPILIFPNFCVQLEIGDTVFENCKNQSMDNFGILEIAQIKA